MKCRTPIERPPAAATAEGQPKALEANDHVTVARRRLTGKGKPRVRRATFRSADGRTWSYSGKRALVLERLAWALDGITPFDTIAFNLRLGASIHAMRQRGLDIETSIDAVTGHARYRLRTPGQLVVRRKGGLL